MYDDLKGMFIVIGILLLLSVILIADITKINSSPIELSGTVLQLVFSSSESNSGVGIAVNSNGGVSPVIINSSKAEKWEVILDLNGSIESYEVNPNSYYKMVVGEKAILICTKGNLFGIVTNCKLKEN